MVGRGDVTSTGYGDVFPTTPLGRVTGSVLMLGGIALIGIVYWRCALCSEATNASTNSPPARQLLRTEIAEQRKELLDRAQAVPKA